MSPRTVRECRHDNLTTVTTLGVTGWRRWRGLPLAPAESVVSLVATLSGQSLASVRDLYKREETCEYSFGFVFFPSGMTTHSYATRLAGLTGRFGLSSPAADQRPAAALREAPPNSDGSEGNDLTTQLTWAVENLLLRYRFATHHPRRKCRTPQCRAVVMTAFSDGPRRHLRRPKPRPAHGSEDKDSLFGQLTLPNHPGIPQHQRAGFALAALSLVACAVLALAWQDSAVMRPLPKASSTALAGHFLAPGATAVPPPRAIIPEASPTLQEASSTALA